MIFEAYYSKAKLALMAVLGVLFAALGAWMLTQTADDMADGGGRKIVALANLFGTEPATMAHIIGWLCIAMGVAVLPIVLLNLRHKGPAMRIDANGVYWHRWSEETIPWTNIDTLKPYSVQAQKFVGITLFDPSLTTRKGLLGKLKGVNNALGYGHVALSLQGTDGDYAGMVETLMYHASTRH